jgi:CubicO group peptidase (beta-lactamase class C family)
VNRPRTEDLFPASGAWPKASARDVGLNEGALQKAVAFATNHETDWPRSMYMPNGHYIGTAYVQESGPNSDVVGPVKERGPANGMIIRYGKLVASWGDVSRVDMTFSIAKSYLGVLAGLAVADGLIADIDRPVIKDVPGPWFESPHNAAVTWRHLLQQTSEWSGTLWGKPDSIDHNRQVGTTSDNSRKGAVRAMKAPGEYFEYNDVRVNLLAAALLMRFRRPLPDVLKERIMDPIGASNTWEWHGYSTSWVEIDGKRMQSVSGGGHWGGGIFIASPDHARFGYLVSRGGKWGNKQLIPETWVKEMLKPSPRNEGYGFMWWLNGGEKRYPSAPSSSVFALGAGTSIIWIDRDHDLLVVARWADKGSIDGLCKHVLAAIE